MELLLHLSHHDDNHTHLMNVELLCTFIGYASDAPIDANALEGMNGKFLYCVPVPTAAQPINCLGRVTGQHQRRVGSNRCVLRINVGAGLLLQLPGDHGGAHLRLERREQRHRLVVLLLILGAQRLRQRARQLHGQQLVDEHVGGDGQQLASEVTQVERRVVGVPQLPGVGEV